jgi:tryptophanyl-tRNA synthetase
MQSASSFATSFPFIFGEDKKKVAKIACLIPCAIDQDPYFRQCRDNARQLGLVKPALIHSVFLPSLKGAETKMSASDPDSGVWFSDTPKQIQKKIGLSFSGGQETLEMHRELGGRSAVDIPYQYLTFFFEDDEELERIRVAYEKGEMLTGEIKKICTQELQKYVNGFQERRKQVTPEIRAEFLRPRPLQFVGRPFADVEAARTKEIAALEQRIAALKTE